MIQELIERGAIFVVNHSGGKDSQAMYLHLREIIPHDQLIVVHADLPGVDWDGSVEHIKATVDHEVHVVRAKKTFFDMVRHRNMFPSPSYRQCTSDLKRDPIDKFVRNFLKDQGKKLVVNCMGLRAQESPARAKKVPFKTNKRNSKAGRECYDWLPIFDWTTKEVFDRIKQAGQKPFWTYGQGMKRKSCRFCIMACKSDLQIAAKLAPKAWQEMVELEKSLGGYTVFQGETLTEKIQ